MKRYFLVKISLTEGECSIDSSEGEGLSISWPTGRYDFLFELLLRDFLLSRDKESEVSCSPAEQLVSEGVEGESQDCVILSQLQNWFNLLIWIWVKLPEDASAVSADSKDEYDAVAKVLPSLAKAIELIGSLAKSAEGYLPLLVWWRLLPYPRCRPPEYPRWPRREGSRRCWRCSCRWRWSWEVPVWAKSKRSYNLLRPLLNLVHNFELSIDHPSVP